MKNIVKLVIASAVLICMIVSLAPHSRATSQKPLSPALNIIAASNPIIMSTQSGEKISFSQSEFQNALGVSDLDNIIITSLPPSSAGRLTLGSLVVTKGQAITASSLSSLVFTPNSGTKKAEFSFTAGSEYAYTAVLHFIDERNYSPTSIGIDGSFFRLKTYKNIAVSGSMRAVDPEGDSVKYEIVSYPEKGLLTVKDRVSGEYTYTPTKNYIGNDSFSFIAVDSYGNSSEKIRIDISVGRNDGVGVFKDMIFSSGHYGALLLDSMGIMKGRIDEGENVFMPDKEVSYGDFLKASMTAANIPLKENTTSEISKIVNGYPKEYRPYLLTAYEYSIISLEELSAIDIARNVTKAEACVILDALIDAENAKTVPVFDDIESVPSYALDAVCALIDIGVVRTENGLFEPTEPLTRADAAEMLAAIVNRK